jgi:putative chitinase
LKKIPRRLDSYARTNDCNAAVGCGSSRSRGFRTVEEFSSGNEYEGRRDLGNTEPGDGARFKARGLLGFPTGRANYASLSQGLGYGTRLVESPEDVMIPEIAARAVCFYLKSAGQRMLDALKNDDIVSVTRMINGGLSGLDDRRQYSLKFKEILSHPT